MNKIASITFHSFNVHFAYDMQLFMIISFSHVHICTMNILLYIYHYNTTSKHLHPAHKSIQHSTKTVHLSWTCNWFLALLFFEFLGLNGQFLGQTSIWEKWYIEWNITVSKWFIRDPWRWPAIYQLGNWCVLRAGIW